MKFGIFDCKDQCWMGNEKGPLEYDEEMPGRAAATIMNEMFEEHWRYRCRPLDPPPFKLKDTVEAKYDGAEALARIEARG